MTFDFEKMYKEHEAKKQEAIRKAEAHNKAVEDFYEVDLVKHFGSDMITAEQWFEAQQIINQQNFYEKVKAIHKELKRYGVRAAINMQRDTITFYE